MSEYTPDMSVRTPIFTAFPEIFSCASAGLAAPATTLRAAQADTADTNPNLMNASYDLDLEIFMQHVLLVFQLVPGNFGHDAAVLDDVHPIGERRGEVKILLDEDDGVALLLELADDLAELLHDDRRQALGDLVEEEEPRAGAEDARHGQHLLLAAGEAHAGALAPLAQVREHRVQLLDGHAARRDARRQHEVLL